ncbi:PAS domain S-box protein, partial [Desulfonatronospira sp.]|uniref:PAS domain S-box protein n=1 Tax=Desulfonatronospira sp. TaxID=1962951 RepID=UPI0025BCC758
MPQDSASQDFCILTPEQCQDLFTNAPIGIYTSTPEGKLLSVNPALAKKFGYESPQKMLESVTDIAAQTYVKSEDRLEFMRLMQEYGKVVDHECRFRRKDGTKFWASINAYAVWDENGRVKAYQGFTRDISKRKQAHEALLESDKRFRAVFENMPGGVFIHDLDGKFLMVNEAACRNTGYSKQELLQMQVKDIDPHLLDSDKRFQAWNDLKESQSTSFESVHIRKDGSCYPVDIYLNLITLDGKPVIFAAAYDITGRKRAEEALRESEVKHRTIFQVIPDMIIKLSKTGQYLDIYASSEDKLALPRIELLKKNITDIFPEQESSLILQRIEKALDTQELEVIEYELKVQTGKCYFEARAMPVGKEEVICLVRDITERKRTEEALRDSEDRHRRLFETMAQGVIYQAADGSIISANPAAERILGISLEQMQGKTSMDPRWKMIMEDGTAVPGEDHPAMITLRTGETVGPVVRGVFHPDKHSYIWLSITAIPLFQPGDSKPFQAYATFEDITERKCAEEALREKTQLLDTIANTMSDLVSVTDMEGNYTYIGPSHSILGYDLDSLVGRNVMEFVHPDDYQRIENALMEFLTNEEDGKKVEYRYRRDDGEYLWFETIGKFILDNAGNPKELLFSTRDVTERKQAEEALREREAFIQATLDNLPVGVAVNSVDPKVQFTYMNDNFAKFYRTTREALAAPNDFWEVVYTDATFREEIKKRVVEDCASNDPERMTWQDVPVARQDQDTFYITAKNIPLPENNLMVSTVWDVTNRKLAEDDLVSTKEAAEAANRAKSEFLANMSHELRTPLNGILGMLQLLQSTTDLDHEQNEYVELGITSANRLTRLLSDILDLSRVEAGKMEIIEEEFRTKELVDSVTDLFKVTIKEKDLSLVFQLDPALPEKLVGDPARL